jgi:hypothetical protein
MNFGPYDEGLRNELSKQGVVYHDAGGALQLGPEELALAAAIRPGLLRH